MTHDLVPGRGEQRLKDNSRRYRKIIIGLCASGGVVGIAMGTLLGMHVARNGFHDTDFPAMIQWAAIIAVVVFVVAVTIGSWIYLRAIDELELEANKIAGLIGLNVYGILYMPWWSLAKVGVTGAPNDEAIFLITMASAIVTFLWRRFR